MSGSERRLRLVPLGGLGEFGLNAMVLECGNRAVLIDAGAMFPAADLPGVERIVPDFRYLAERPHGLEAVLLTHGHEDHIGGLAEALRAAPAPVYGSRLTLGFVRGRLREQGVAADLREMAPSTSLSLGPFTVHPIRVAHSTCDSLALAIETPGGTVLASGDFKMAGGAGVEESTDTEALATWGQRGVRVLLADSTGAEQRGRTASEDEVVPAFEEVFERTRGRVLVSCFASSIPRMQRVADVAERQGRVVGFVGRRMRGNAVTASELGLLRLPATLARGDFSSRPASRQALFVSGSQAEPLSALSQVAAGAYPGLDVGEDDTLVLSARAIPGNERAISRVISAFMRAGCDVVHPGTARVHVSGHGNRDDLLELLRLTRPEFVVPIHGEYRNLAALARLTRETDLPAEGVLVLEDGEVLAIDEAGARRDPAVQVGRLALDSAGQPVDEATLRQRRRLAHNGVLVPVLVRRRGTAEMACLPRVMSFGLAETANAASLLETLALRAAEIATAESAPSDSEALSELLAQELGRLFKRETRRRPAVLPVLMEV